MSRSSKKPGGGETAERRWTIGAAGWGSTLGTERGGSKGDMRWPVRGHKRVTPGESWKDGPGGARTKEQDLGGQTPARLGVC